MPTEYTCPGCDATVLVPNQAAAILGRDEQLGCANTTDHDEGEPLVMWSED